MIIRSQQLFEFSRGSQPALPVILTNFLIHNQRVRALADFKEESLKISWCSDQSLLQTLPEEPVLTPSSPECDGDRRSVWVVALRHHLRVLLVDPAGVVLLLADVVHEVPLVLTSPTRAAAPRHSPLPTGAYYVELVKLKR